MFYPYFMLRSSYKAQRIAQIIQAHKLHDKAQRLSGATYGELRFMDCISSSFPLWY